MDFDLVKRKVISNKFSLSYRNGERLYEDGKVEIVDVKEIDNVNYIYGRVNDERKIFSTFIKIDSKGRLLKLSCNCDINEEARRSGGNFACSHIIATALELGNNGEKEEIRKDNIELSLLITDSFKEDYSYDISLYLKDKSRLKIDSRADLEYNVLNDRAVYSFKRIGYSKADKTLIKKIHKLNFKLRDEDIREFLFLCRYKKVHAKISSCEYNTNIITKDMPLRFTLKVEGKRIKLQRRKDVIIALNNEKTAFIFNEEIYIPPFKQCRAFSMIYSVLKDKYYTYVNKSSLKKVIKVLSSIGELNIHDEVKDIMAEEEEIELYFFTDNSDIYCEFLNEKYYFKGSSKIKNIEENLFLSGFTKKNDKYLFTRDKDELFRVIKGEIGRLCNIKSSEELGSLNIISMNKFKGKIEKGDNSLVFNLEAQELQDELYDAVQSFKKGDEFYRFKNLSFLDFSDKETRSYMKFLSFINYNGQETNIKEGYEELFFEEGRKLNFLDLIERDKGKEELLESPKGLKGTLRNYQLNGLRWLQNKKDNKSFGVLADEMGLGKTIQTISFLLNNKGDLSMIIAPTSLVYNWLSEFKKFAPKLKIACVHGDKKKRERVLSNIKDYDIILTSYGTINMDIDLYDGIKFDNLILDEGQTIKNPNAKVTINVKKIDAECKFVLTGTPLENNFLELWSIFDFLKKDYLFSENEFKRKFKGAGEDEIKYLRLLIKPFILRRTKKEVLKELPEKNEKILYASMTEEQKKFYKNSIRKVRNDISDMNNSISILALLTKLREIALDPCLIDEDYKGGSGKTEEFLKLIKESIKDKKKVLVFSQFTGMLNILKEKLQKLNIQYYYLDGSTKADERVRLCSEFNKKKRTKVFLISLKAGGTGLNLTSAERVIHFDPWWNPAVENQATDRAHRIGQKNEVEVIKIISKGTIEEKILKLKEEKNKMIEDLLMDESGKGFTKTALTSEEIEYLLAYDE